jgi:formylglycine-generating enzyme required for sulfatase activity
MSRAAFTHWYAFPSHIIREVELRALQFIAVTWLALVCALTAAHAEKRVALVVGNDRYANLPAHEQLQKAVNDARSVGATLGQLGFEVMSGENVGRQALVDKLDAFARRLSPGDTAFFFFSGHGVAIGGANYILPADTPDVEADQETRLARAALAEHDIVTDLQARGVRITVVVLDACRTNPFRRTGAKGVGGEKGLAPPPPVQGVFSIYAAGAGQAARDRLSDDDHNPNSVFTRVLIPALTKPGVDLTALAFDVREEVARIAKQAGYEQRPAYYDETIGGRVYLAGMPAVVVSPVTPAVPADDPCSGLVTTSFASRCAAVLTAEQERGLKPKDTFRECESCPEMVVVPAGAFSMGSTESEKDHNDNEGPHHVVTISRPFAVGKFHVTVDQFGVFARETGYVAHSGCDWRNPGFTQEGSHPVVCVSWDDAKAYAKWLAKKTGKPYRLLSEAEFEYAARGQTHPGTYPRFWFGDDEKELCKYGNFNDQKAGNSGAPCDDGYDRTSPAGHYAPNAFGLYDMAGNAWQWTEDCWHSNYSGAPADGSAWTTSCKTGHVVRGGSWFNASGGTALRVSGAGKSSDPGQSSLVGFRVARL